MAVRTRYALQYSISSSTAEEKDLANGKFEVVSDDLNDGGTRLNVLAGGATNTQLSMADIANAKLLIIRTKAHDPTLDCPSIRIRRNLITAEEIEIAPLLSTREGHMLLSTTGLTALFATNLSASVSADVTVTLAGD